MAAKFPGTEDVGILAFFMYMAVGASCGKEKYDIDGS